MHQLKSTQTKWLLIGICIIAALILFAVFPTQMNGIAPYLLIALCPLMHIFMHRGGHGGHSEGEKSPVEESSHCEKAKNINS